MFSPKCWHKTVFFCLGSVAAPFCLLFWGSDEQERAQISDAAEASGGTGGRFDDLMDDSLD